MIRIKYPVLTLVLLWCMLYKDTMGIIRISLLCSLLHELGHILVWIAIKHNLPELMISPTGIGLQISSAGLTCKQEFALALSGPLMNFFLAAITWAVMQKQPSYYGYFFMGANVLVGAFNLLPLSSLDGKRLLNNLFHR